MFYYSKIHFFFLKKGGIKTDIKGSVKLDRETVFKHEKEEKLLLKTKSSSWLSAKQNPVD